MSDTAHTGPVVLVGDELGSPDAPLADLHAAALAHARTHFQGRTVVNRATGWAVTFGRAGINKTLNHAARLEHVQSLPALPALLVRAEWVSQEANRDPRELRNVPWVHTFTAELLLAGRAFRARLIVKETNVGHRFYDHDVLEETKPAGSGPVADLPKEGATAPKPAGFDVEGIGT